MAFVINASDIMDFGTMPAPKSMQKIIQPDPQNTAPRYFHAAVGLIDFSHMATSYMHVTDMKFNTLGDFELHDVDSMDTININFFINGSLDTSFAGLSHDFKMRPMQHNLVYSPESKDVSYVSANQTVEMLHISLQKDFFISCLGTSDSWSERILNELLHERPFSGNRHNPATTPYMMRLIDAVRNNKETGSMKNLMIQSRILELLALQMEQFRVPQPIHEELRHDETEKLYQLKTYLDTHFLSDLSLTQLSKECLLNEFKVKRGFKLLFGTTVFNYLRKLRMEYAGNMLTCCPVSIDEVADALGYEHSQHFSIAFKKYMGISPSVYQSKGSSHRISAS